MEKFTSENYTKGFLMDEELIGGISEVPGEAGTFTAYVVRHTTGETLGVQNYSNVFEAIRNLNDIERNWSFEAVSRCGGGNCKSGNCKKEGGATCTKKTPSSVNVL